MSFLSSDATMSLTQRHHSNSNSAGTIVPLAMYNESGDIILHDTCQRFLRRLDREVPNIFTDRVTRDSILDYDRLKRHLKNVLHYDRSEQLSAVSDDEQPTNSSNIFNDIPPSTSYNNISSKRAKPHELFWCVIRSEVDKCNTFVLNKENEYIHTLDNLSLTLQSIQFNSDNTSSTYSDIDQQSVQSQLHQLCHSFDVLAQYIVISYMALYKLVKAYDYHTGRNSITEFIPEIADDAMCGNCRIGALMVRLQGMIESSHLPVIKSESTIRPLTMHCNTCDNTRLIVRSNTCSHTWCLPCLARAPYCGQSCPQCGQEQIIELDQLVPEMITNRYPQLIDNIFTTYNTSILNNHSTVPMVHRSQSAHSTVSTSSNGKQSHTGTFNAHTAQLIANMIATNPSLAVAAAGNNNNYSPQFLQLLKDQLNAANNNMNNTISTATMTTQLLKPSSSISPVSSLHTAHSTSTSPAIHNKLLDNVHSAANNPSSTNNGFTSSHVDTSDASDADLTESQRLTILNGKPVKKAYSCHQCISIGSSITLSNGISIPIESIVRERDHVLGWQSDAINSSHNGLVHACVGATINNGIRACKQLTLADGRSLICTADHQILRSDGTWTQAQLLRPNTDSVACGVQYPEYAPEPQSTWQYQCANITLRVNTMDSMIQSVAFCRLLGLMETGCTLNYNNTNQCHQSVIHVGHILDVESVLSDIKLLTDQSIQPILNTTALTSTWMICLPLTLVNAFIQCNVLVGKRTSHQSPQWPSFITAQCPTQLIRAYLSGMFGGDGRTPCLSNNTGDVVHAKLIRFKSTKLVQHIPVLREYYEEMRQLLARCGIPLSSTDINISALTVLDDGSGANKQSVDMCVHDVLGFYRSISFSHCVHKQQRLAAIASYEAMKQFEYTHSNILRMDEWLKKINAYQYFHHAEMEDDTMIFDNMDMSVVSTDDSISDYSDNDTNTPYYIDIDSDSICGTSTSSIKHVYAVPDNVMRLPTFDLPVVDVRDVADTQVYDLTIQDGISSFTANGIVVHNCKSKKMAHLLLFCCGKTDGTWPRRRCRKKYCVACLDRYGVNITDVNRNLEKMENWRCPSCQNVCTCAACLRKPGATEAQLQAAHPHSRRTSGYSNHHSNNNNANNNHTVQHNSITDDIHNDHMTSMTQQGTAMAIQQLQSYPSTLPLSNESLRRSSTSIPVTTQRNDMISHNSDLLSATPNLTRSSSTPHNNSYLNLLLPDLASPITRAVEVSPGNATALALPVPSNSIPTIRPSPHTNSSSEASSPGTHSIHEPMNEPRDVFHSINHNNNDNNIYSSYAYNTHPSYTTGINNKLHQQSPITYKFSHNNLPSLLDSPNSTSINSNYNTYTATNDTAAAVLHYNHRYSHSVENLLGLDRPMFAATSTDQFINNNNDTLLRNTNDDTIDFLANETTTFSTNNYHTPIQTQPTY